jgi:KDO2-lipid IV(A) lauroyltransferase
VSQYYLIPKRIARALPWLGKAGLWFEAQGFRFIFWVTNKLSLERACRIGGFAFELVGPHTAKARKALINLSVAFPESSEQWRRDTMREIFRSLGYAAAELIKLNSIWAERDQRLEFVIQPGALSHLQAGGGTMFVCAHTGPWQLTNLIALHCDLSISTIYAPESNPYLRDMMLDLRQAFGVKLVPTDAGVRPLVKELNAGRCVGMAMDTRLDTGKLIPFFGRDALTNTSAARLALRTDAAIIPIRAERLAGFRFRVTVYDPLTSDIPDAPAEEQALDITRKINSCFESWIREAPGQWICLKRRWPKAHKL